MKNRRKGPDFIINMIKWISIVIWIIIAIVVILLMVSNPTSAGMQMSRPALQTTSSKAVNSAIFLLLVIQLIMSVSGLVFNFTRLKRKTDRLRISLVLSGLFAILGIVIMSVK
ncbi:MAG TPA: hypothetical protein PK986_11715 [Spirochaetota bacterium]|nr:hypothetical protein [Spirochaetota bacterium]HQO41129.1 hypothetical protein [Spirochaetota bacterium]